MNAPITGEPGVERELTAAFDEMAAGYVPTPMDASTLWATGRRERRSDLIQIVAAVLVLVVVVASVWRLQAPDPGPADSPSGGALPTQVHYPHNEQIDAVERPDGMHTGVLSVVAKDWHGPAIGVRASDGTHLLLDLPDLGEGGGDSGLDIDSGAPIALSHDGTHLAWAYRTSGNATSGGESAGITVAELTTGESYSVELRGPSAERLAVDHLTFSPDGTQIGWLARAYTEGVGVSGDQYVGVLDRDVRSSTTGTETSNISALTVLDDGTLHTHHHDGTHQNWAADEFRALQPGRPTPARTDVELEYGAANLHVSPDGASIVGSTPYRDTWGVVAEPVDDLTASATVTDHALTATEESRPVSGSSNALIGLSPDGIPVLAYVEANDDGGRREGRVVARADDPDGPPTVLTRVDGFATPLVAIDFADAEPVAFAAPDLSRNPTPTWVWWLLGAAGTLAAGRLLVLLARRSRSNGGGAWIRPAGTSVAAAGLTGALVVTLAPILEPRTEVTSELGALPATLHPDTWAGAPTSKAPGPLAAFGQAPSTYDVYTGISPVDGQPVSVDLPASFDRMSMSMDSRPDLLSPDGTLLAYTWNGADPDVYVEYGERNDVARGLAVLDLTTGQTRTVALKDLEGDDIQILDLSWSPDSRWLGWRGVSTRKRNRMQQWVGLTPVPDLADTELADTELASTAWSEQRGNYRAIAAGDGVLHLLAGKHLITYDVDEAAPVRDVALADSPDEWGGAAVSPDEWGGAAVSPDGKTLYAGLAGENSTSYATGIRMIDLTAAEPRLETSAWRSDLPVRVEGVTPSGDVVLSETPDGFWRERLFRIDPESGTSTPILTYPDTHTGVSWALGLADRDAVEFPPPPPEVSAGRIMLASLLGVSLLLLLGSIVRSSFTRRRQEA